jgi:hypothetical protein
MGLLALICAPRSLRPFISDDGPCPGGIKYGGHHGVHLRFVTASLLEHHALGQEQAQDSNVRKPCSFREEGD